MPRLLGVDIPNDKPTVISLSYLFGVGAKTARELCHKAGVEPQKRLASWLTMNSGGWRLCWSVITWWRVHYGVNISRASIGCGISNVIAVCDIGLDYRCVGNVREPMPARARVLVRRWPAKRALRICAKLIQLLIPGGARSIVRLWTCRSSELASVAMSMQNKQEYSKERTVRGKD